MKHLTTYWVTQPNIYAYYHNVAVSILHFNKTWRPTLHAANMKARFDSKLSMSLQLCNYWGKSSPIIYKVSCLVTNYVDANRIWLNIIRADCLPSTQDGLIAFACSFANYVVQRFKCIWIMELYFLQSGQLLVRSIPFPDFRCIPIESSWNHNLYKLHTFD